MTTAEVFRETAVLLKERGWIQGQDESERGVCLMAALNATLDKGSPPWCEAIERLRSETVRRGSGGAITQWNDAPGRTLPEVLDLLETCAQKAEAGGPATGGVG